MKQDDAIEQCHQVLQYAILVDSVYPCEQLIESMRVVLYKMTRINKNRGHALRRGRPKIRIDEEQLEFLVEISLEQNI